MNPPSSLGAHVFTAAAAHSSVSAERSAQPIARPPAPSSPYTHSLSSRNRGGLRIKPIDSAAWLLLHSWQRATVSSASRGSVVIAFMRPQRRVTRRAIWPDSTPVVQRRSKRLITNSVHCGEIRLAAGARQHGQSQTERIALVVYSLSAPDSAYIPCILGLNYHSTSFRRGIALVLPSRTSAEHVTTSCGVLVCAG